MRAPGTIRIAVTGTGAVRAGPDGTLADDALVPERRGRKVGALPDTARLTLAAVRRCLGETPLPAGERTGISLGTYFGATDVAERCLDTVRGPGFAEVTPSWYATGLPNATAAIVAALHEATGPNLTLLGWHAGLGAIVAGCRQIAAGRCDTVLAGGFDRPSPRYAALLATDPAFAPAAVHAGAAVLRLDRAAPDGGVGEGPPRATVVGWSQAEAHAGESDDALAARLTGAAAALADGAAGTPGAEPAAIRFLAPGRTGAADHLAASAPLHLVEALLTAPVSGRTAVVARGLGSAAACLLLDAA